MFGRGNVTGNEGMFAIDIANWRAWCKSLLGSTCLCHGIAIGRTPIGQKRIEQYGSAFGTVWTSRFPIFANFHESDLTFINLVNCSVVTLVDCHGGTLVVIIVATTTTTLIGGFDGGAGESVTVFNGLDDGDTGMTLAVEDDFGGAGEGGFEGTTFAFESVGFSSGGHCFRWFIYLYRRGWF